MNAQHTPGPWEFTFFCQSNGEPILTVDDVASTIAESARHSDRAELFGVTLPPDEAGFSTVVCYTGNGPNAHNNARLIAAAPDLLDALQRLKTYLGSLNTGPHATAYTREVFEKARAAIAKATGVA